MFGFLEGCFIFNCTLRVLSDPYPIYMQLHAIVTYLPGGEPMYALIYLLKSLSSCWRPSIFMFQHSIQEIQNTTTITHLDLYIKALDLKNTSPNFVPSQICCNDTWFGPVHRNSCVLAIPTPSVKFWTVCFGPLERRLHQHSSTQALGSSRSQVWQVQLHQSAPVLHCIIKLCSTTTTANLGWVANIMRRAPLGVHRFSCLLTHFCQVSWPNPC